MRILVGLIEHMGDIIACEPVSRYLKAAHPAAHLTWAVSAAYRELADTNPYIDQTLVLECLTDWIKLTKHSSWDNIVDLHINYRICQHCGIPLIKEKGNPFVNVYEWFDHGTLQEAFTLGAGLPALSAQPNLYLKPEHAKAVDALALPDNFCVVHHESNDRAKDWRREAWRKLSEWIRDDLELQIVEVGADKVCSPSPLAEGSISLVNRLPLLQTAEVIRRARFFIGVDSGPAHLANALRVPGIVLLGRLGFFRQYMPFNGFFASRSPLVKMVRNPAGPACTLSVDEVIEAVRYVAAASATQRNATLPAAVRYVAAASASGHTATLPAAVRYVTTASATGHNAPLPVAIDTRKGAHAESHRRSARHPMRRTAGWFWPLAFSIRPGTAYNTRMWAVMGRTCSIISSQSARLKGGRLAPTSTRVVICR